MHSHLKRHRQVFKIMAYCTFSHIILLEQKHEALEMGCISCAFPMWVMLHAAARYPRSNGLSWGIVRMTNIVTHFTIVSIHHSHVFNMMQKDHSNMKKQGSFTQFMMRNGS